MKNNMFDLNVWHGLEEQGIADVFNNEGWRTGLLEKEMAFDAADIMKFGKDLFLRKTASANNMALDWLRREFPDMRVHLFHCLDAYERHADCELVPLCPPTAGKEGLVMTHYKYPILDAETKIFKDNDWRVVCVPPPQSETLAPLSIPGPGLVANFLSISPNVVCIEETDVELYHVLEDLGFDVITVPFRVLKEFGGGLHCATWDVKR
jgi:glycine amidinotransferase